MTEPAVRPGEPGRNVAFLVDLRFRERPRLDREALLRAIRARSGLRVETAPVADPTLLLFPEVPNTFADGAVPAQIAILRTEGEPKGDLMQRVLEQTWDWRGVREVIASAPHSMVVTEVVVGAIDRELRLRVLHAALAALVELLAPVALVFVHEQRAVEPEHYLAAIARDPAGFESITNVRLLRFEGAAEDEFVMDTLGMTHFGLPDVQLQSAGLEPSIVGGKVWGIARYLFDNGDVIRDGHTVSGLEEEDRWPCRHEESIAEPSRIVLDVDAGPYRPSRRFEPAAE